MCTTMRYVFAPHIHRAVRMDLEPGISVIDFVWTLWGITLRVPTAVKVSVVPERTWIQQQLASPRGAERNQNGVTWSEIFWNLDTLL